MTLTSMVVAWMLALQPAAPWLVTYANTAEAIAEIATESPLYRGPRAIERTAALLTAIAWHEGRFDPHAIGDEGASVCPMQIGVSNLRALGATREELLSDVHACFRAGLRMIRESFAVCRSRAPADRLAHYAAGGLGCSDRGTRASQHRTALAEYLLRRSDAR